VPQEEVCLQAGAMARDCRTIRVLEEANVSVLVVEPPG
jgi:hypothetical protein